MPTLSEWTSLLQQWSQHIIESGEYEDQLSPDTIASGWLGYTGASEAQIQAAERRLGIVFPPSYRAFLHVTNGWRMTSSFIDKLWSTDEINWYVKQDPETVEIWSDDEEDVPDEEYLVYDERGDQPLRGKYFRTALAISEDSDGVYLLNPQVVTAEGEWEAWFFASWIPGAQRYRSFWDLMQAEYQSFIHHIKYKRGEPTPRVNPELGIDADDFEGLVLALKHPQHRHQIMALDALGNLRDTRAFEPVLTMFQDRDEDVFVREQAARTLGMFRDVRAVQPLIDAFRLPPDSPDQVNLALILSSIEDMQGSEALKNVSFDQMLNELESGVGTPLINHLRTTLALTAVNHGFTEHLHQAVKQGLLELGAIAVTILRTSLQDPDPNVRAKVAEIVSYLEL